MIDGPGSSPSGREAGPESKEAQVKTGAERRDPAPSAPAQDFPPLPPPKVPRGNRDDSEDLGGSMTFLEHLDELRKRIIHSAVAVALAFCISWAFSEEIFRFLAVPIADVVGGVDRLVFTRPTEPFSIWLKVSFAAAVFLSVPYLLLQVWLFIAPGLYRREKSLAVPFLVISTLLFILGGAFAYYVILPTALEFLINQFGAPFQPMVSAIEYFNFEVLVLVGMGVIFQIPVLIAFLSIFGMVTPGFLWRNFRYAFLLILIVAAVVSPTADVLNLFLWSGPMVVLYLVSIGVSWVFKRRRDKRLNG